LEARRFTEIDEKLASEYSNVDEMIAVFLKKYRTLDRFSKSQLFVINSAFDIKFTSGNLDKLIDRLKGARA